MSKIKTAFLCILVSTLFSWMGCSYNDLQNKIEIDVENITSAPSPGFVFDTITNKVSASGVINGQPGQIESVKWSIVDPDGNEVAPLNSAADSVTWIPQLSGIYKVKVEVSKSGKSNQAVQDVSIKALSNRIQIFRKSKLRQEFVFNDSLILKTEVAYGSSGANYCERHLYDDYEKLVYNYKGNRVDYVVVFDKNNSVTRREYFYYDPGDVLSKIKYTVNADVWSIQFDYGAILEKWSAYHPDTITFLAGTLSGRFWWYNPDGGGYSYTINANGNIDNLYYTDTWILLSYDNHQSPLYKFKNTGVGPIRMTPNNVTRIESRYVGPENDGGVILNYVADVAYDYNSDGTPKTAIYKYPCGPSDTTKYVYDKVRY